MPPSQGTMNIRIANEDCSSIDQYSSIPISFDVISVFDVTHAPDDEAPRLVERSLEHSYVKNYDVIQGDSPLEWPGRFDLSSWRFFVAYAGEQRVGGVVLIMDSPDIEMLEGRKDLALLWDVRVAPSFRASCVGSTLLAAAESWSIEHGAKDLKVETQNINVSACRFYESRGFELRQANAGVYPGLPNEVQLLWYKSLA